MTFYQFASENPWLTFGLAMIINHFAVEFFRSLFKAMS